MGVVYPYPCPCPERGEILFFDKGGTVEKGARATIVVYCLYVQYVSGVYLKYGVVITHSEPKACPLEPLSLTRSNG
jgi:hypothetical protein